MCSTAERAARGARASPGERRPRGSKALRIDVSSENRPTPWSLSCSADLPLARADREAAADQRSNGMRVARSIAAFCHAMPGSDPGRRQTRQEDRSAKPACVQSCAGELPRCSTACPPRAFLQSHSCRSRRRSPCAAGRGCRPPTERTRGDGRWTTAAMSATMYRSRRRYQKSEGLKVYTVEKRSRASSMGSRSDRTTEVQRTANMAVEEKEKGNQAPVRHPVCRIGALPFGRVRSRRSLHCDVHYLCRSTQDMITSSRAERPCQMQVVPMGWEHSVKSSNRRARSPVAQVADGIPSCWSPLCWHGTLQPRQLIARPGDPEQNTYSGPQMAG
ncbi:hypothetical protein BD413DRAFT_88173 [Trametes elegans]|nr:hypothetical protein BD413DRAFT_88173 [Trametes elegans]